MTRKDYVAIANVLARFTPMSTERPIGAVAVAIADSLANALARDNPNFNRTRFMQACGAALGYQQEAA